jgi:SAM-dependent methyltransferase
MSTISLDLGCGPNPRNIFKADEVWGIDIRSYADKPEIRVADLVVEKIPFEDASFDFVTAHDFLEHVPRILYMPGRRFPFVELMGEIWRVLKTGGRFFSYTPAFPHAAVFRDPTHVNIIAEDTFSLYFDDQNRWGTMYGFQGAFKILQQSWMGPHLCTVMEKVDVPGPPPVR